MNGKTQKMRRRLSTAALIVSVAAVGAPIATAGGPRDPGLVPSKLGTVDPRDTARSEKQSVEIRPEAGLVASTLGSPDVRDALLRSDVQSMFGSAAQEHGASGYDDAR